MNQGFVQDRTGTIKKAFVGLATAVLCSAIFPAVASAACGPQAGQGRGAAMPVWRSFRNLASPAAGKTTATAPTGPTIVGLWHVLFVSGGQTFDEGFDQWHSDGTEILNDNSVPPSLGNVCLGVFVKTGPGTYQLNHPAWNWDANGNLIGTVAFLETVTVASGGNTYQGTFVFDTYDLSGNLLSEVTGTLSAERITAD